MPTSKRLICLANSRKPGGACIAGIELGAHGSTGTWVRPIGDRTGEEVTWSESRLLGGRQPQLLDIVQVPLLSRRPNPVQPENWVVDASKSWSQVGRLAPADLASLTASGPLWLSGWASVGGQNDRIPEAQASGLGSSLALIHVDRINLVVSVPGRPFGNLRRRVRGQFDWAGERYGLWVTDPLLEDAYASRDEGSYEMKDVYLTISLTTANRGFCYKLVAAAIAEP